MQHLNLLLLAIDQVKEPTSHKSLPSVAQVCTATSSSQSPKLWQHIFKYTMCFAVAAGRPRGHCPALPVRKRKLRKGLGHSHCTADTLCDKLKLGQANKSTNYTIHYAMDLRSRQASTRSKGSSERQGSIWPSLQCPKPASAEQRAPHAKSFAGSNLLGVIAKT